LELDADAQRTFGLALGASFAREGNADGACRVFEQLLTAGGASPLDAAEVRQRYAQALRQAGRWDGARKQYASVAADQHVPPLQRGLAALAVGQTWQQDGKLAEAAEAFQAAASAEQVPHVKAEAEACAAECANLLAGKPARDPEAHRQRLRALPSPAVEYVVSPKGSDANPGTLEKPFATLERARDAVRGSKVKGVLPRGGAAVYLRGGRYAVTNTFELAAADSGSFGAPVVYRAWRDDKPVFDGGFRVRGFSKVKAPAALSRLPPEARGQVRVADLKAQGFTSLDEQRSYGYGIANKTVRELYQDGAPLQIARWPNAESLKIAEVLDLTNRVFACKTERLARWSSAADLMVNGYWVHLWAGCTVPVASVDPVAGTFTLREKPGYGMVKERPFYVLNLLEEIDRTISLNHGCFTGHT
jgi:tetratricopeptide (TPR) repeat protein